MPSMLDLLSPQDAAELKRASMLSFAAGLLQNSGWQPRPVGLGQAMGTGLQNYQQTRAQMMPSMLQGSMLARQVTAEDEQKRRMADLAGAMNPGEWTDTGQGAWTRPGTDPDKLASAYARAFPQQAAERAMPERKPYKLGPGEAQFDESNRQVAGVPAEWKFTTAREGTETVTYAVNPQTLQRIELSRGPEWNPNPSPSTMLNIDQKGETEAEKAEGQVVGKMGGGIIEAGNRASESIAQAARLGQLATAYQQAGGDFGPYSEAKLKAATFLPDWARNALNVSDAEIGTGQALMAEANRQVIGLIGPGGFPSNNFSEQDRKFLLTIPPRLTDMGFQAKLLVVQRVSERTEAIGARYRELRSAGVSVADAAARAQADNKQQPLFTPEDMRVIANDKAPQMGGDIEAQAKAAWGAYEPDKYEYGINPTTGNFGRRLKR